MLLAETGRTKAGGTGRDRPEVVICGVEQLRAGQLMGRQKAAVWPPKPRGDHESGCQREEDAQ